MVAYGGTGSGSAGNFNAGRGGLSAGGKPGGAGQGGRGGAGSGNDGGGGSGKSGVGGAAGAGGGAGGMPGGGSGSGGSAGMRGPQELVARMGAGWNLGNTFDAVPNETSWGNPQTTQAMILAVKDAGFKTIRVPVTWTDHIGGAPDYAIDRAWMDKVERVVKWVLDAGLYAIVNTHHDADEQWILLTTAAQPQVTMKVEAVWEQIATRFKSYDDHLIFETFNEPHGPVNPYEGGSAEQQSVLNAYIATALSAIRATGGNNATRAVMIQPHGASPVEAGIKALAIPNDPNLLISIHTYYPTGFSFGPTPTTWGTTDADYADMGASLDQIAAWLPERAIVIGEWGTVSGAQLDSRVKHAKAYAQDVVRRGMCPIWWDNGGTDFGILNRQANPPVWSYPTIVSALIEGAKAGAMAGAVDATKP
jgi:endoglucanase